MTNTAQTRNFGDLPEGPPRRPVGNRWAVLVGISDYQDDGIELRYAHRDAEALRDFLLTPAGGAFAEHRIKCLVNKDATTPEVKRALSTFLADAAEEDLVLIYFACHGAPDLKSRKLPLYLLTHDTDITDITGTALPMDEVAWCLRNYVKAQRMIVFADACHSRGLTLGQRGGRDAEVINSYLAGLSDTAEGFAYFTSAQLDQASIEDENYGGGHGVFTWYLLRGLAGEADGHGNRPHDGLVTLDELADYVIDNVRAETNGVQIPHLGTDTGNFARTVPVAVTKDLDIGAQLALARSFLDVGRLLGDPAPNLVAAQAARAAASLAADAGSDDSEAISLAGEALLAAGAYSEVLTVLPGNRKLTATDRLHRGLALAAGGQNSDAAEELAAYAIAQPDAPHADWAHDYAADLAVHGAVHALLVAVNVQQGDDSITTMVRLATNVWRIPTQRLTVLADDQVTRDAVLAAFDRLAATVRPADSLIVYFSVRTAAGGPDDLYLITHDSTRAGLKGITPAELGRALAAVSAQERLVILDACGNQAANDALSAIASTSVLVAAAPGAQACTGSWGGRVTGLLTGALARTWTGDELTYQGLLEQVNHAMLERWSGKRSVEPQQAIFLGEHTRNVVRGTFAGAGLWEADRPYLVSSPPRGVFDMYEKFGWRNSRRLRARYLEEGHELEKALALLTEAAQERGDQDGWLQVAWHAAYAGADTLPALTAAATSKNAKSDDYAPAEQAAQVLAASRPRALLVGEFDHEVEQMRTFLLNNGFRADEITVAVAASTGEIAAGHQQLLAHCADQFGVLYVSSPTFSPTVDAPNLVMLFDHPVFASSVGERLLPPTGAVVLQPSTPDLEPGDVATGLTQVTLPGLTYRSWAAKAAELIDVGIGVSGPYADGVVFRHRTRFAALIAELSKLVTAGATDAYERARVMTDRAGRQGATSAFASLATGLACRALGRFDEARNSLRSTIIVYEADGGSADLPESAREAAYHLGRLLYELPNAPEDLDDAVVQLGKAHRSAPADPRINLHLGLALRAGIERRTGLEMTASLQRYLWGGAPFGRFDEVDKIIDGVRLPTETDPIGKAHTQAI